MQFGPPGPACDQENWWFYQQEMWEICVKMWESCAKIDLWASKDWCKKNIVILPANICKDSGYNLKLELSGSSENADSGRDCHQRSGCRLGRFLTCLVSGLGEPPTKTNSIKLPIPSFPGTQPWICSKGAKRNPEIFLITTDHIPCTWWVSH